MNNNPLPNKPDLPIWVWSIIGAGGTLLVALVGFGIWAIANPATLPSKQANIQPNVSTPETNSSLSSPLATTQVAPSAKVLNVPISSEPIQGESYVSLKIKSVNTPPPNSLVNEKSVIIADIEYSIRDGFKNEGWQIGTLLITKDGSSVGGFIPLKSPSGSFSAVTSLEQYWNRDDIVKPIRFFISLNSKTGENSSNMILRSREFEFKAP